MWMVFAILLLVACVVLVFLVLSQDVKGGGLAGALGGGQVQTAFGGRSAESIAKLTGWLAFAFFALILLMNVMRPKATGGVKDPTDPNPSAMPNATQPAEPPAPATPPAETPAPVTPPAEPAPPAPAPN